MKNKILVITIICCLFFTYIVAQSVMSQKPTKVAKDIVENLDKSGCTNKVSRDDLLSKSKYFEIRRLGELDSACKSQSGSKLVYTIALPKNDAMSKELASKTADLISENNNYGITPIIFMTLDKDWKQKDTDLLINGKYDTFVTTFFTQLRLLGISDESDVMWVLIPRPNLPLWENTNISAGSYVLMYKKLALLSRTSYPSARTGILLNTATYETAPFNWYDKEYIPLNSYITGIDAKDINFIMFEAYPWMPSQKLQQDLMFTPKEYFSTDNTLALVNSSGIKDVYFLTGTFSTMYTGEADKETKVPSDVRKKLLEDTLAEVRKIKADDRTVNVLFLAKDNSLKADHTDWSYWGSDSTENNKHQLALLDILRSMNQFGILAGFEF